MTTHVFIVTEQSFKVHLEYQFVGTGAKEKDVDFNGVKTSNLNPHVENGLVSMMSDFSRVRLNDFVIFYVQSAKRKEGKFYGVYQISSEPFLVSKTSNQYLQKELNKNLTFRALIKPYKVYAEGVSEWEALDEIKGINSPNQMIWSLIYRKLKGNRGNTMITIYEAERIFNLIKNKNNSQEIQGNCYSYNGDRQVCLEDRIQGYGGSINNKFSILPRLLCKKQAHKSYESHLQMYIIQNLGQSNSSLDGALNVKSQGIEWLGNEVSCGVGMQRIDIMFSQKIDDFDREIVPIELKSIPASADNVRQISRYIDWIEQYYIPNRPSTIRPVLICPASPLSNATKNAFKDFNNRSHGRYLPLEYIEVKDDGSSLIFEKVDYLQ